MESSNPNPNPRPAYFEILRTGKSKSDQHKVDQPGLPEGVHDSSVPRDILGIFQTFGIYHIPTMAPASLSQLGMKYKD
jgi:hypothetical protein